MGLTIGNAIGIPFKKGGQLWTPQFKAVYNAWTIKPSKKDADLWNTMVKILVVNGEWDKLDVFQYYAIHTNDNGEALIDWKNPSNNVKKAVLHGSSLPSFTPYVGFSGNPAASSYIDTRFNPSNAVKYTLNNASFGIYLLDYTADDGICGIRTPTTWAAMKPHAVAGGIASSINNLGNWSNTNNTNKGLFITTRSAANSFGINIYDSINWSNAAVSVSVPNQTFYMLALNNNGTAQDFMTRPVSCFFAGANLDLASRGNVYSGLSLGITYTTKTYGSHIPLPPSLVALQQHGFEACNGKLYSIGGGYFDDCLEYNPTTYKWTRKTNLPSGDVQSPILRAVGNKLYFIGGLKTGGLLQNNVYEYDPVADTYALKAPMPTAREDFGSAVVGSKIYCFGGLTDKAVKILEIYDTSNNTWSTGADMPELKVLGDFGCACNGKVYAISGSNQVYGPGFQEVNPRTTCYVYDPNTNIWSPIASIPVGVVYSERAVIGNYIYVVGGCKAGLSNDNANYTKNIYRYNTLTDVWDKINDAPYAALGSALAELNNEVYLFGGTSISQAEGYANLFYKLKL